MKPLKDNAIINNPYNKGVYTTVVGYGSMVVFKALSEFAGIEISVDLQMYIITFLMILTTIFVPNKDKQ